MWRIDQNSFFGVTYFLIHAFQCIVCIYNAFIFVNLYFPWYITGQESTWHYLLGLYAVLVLLSAATLPILPESPKYLYIVCGQEEKGITGL